MKVLKQGKNVLKDIQVKKDKIDKIKADRVFAKHDENYMPTSIKKQLEKNKYWDKSYQ